MLTTKKLKTKNLKTVAKDVLAMPTLLAQFVASSHNSSKYEQLFAGVETYCMFIGYPRSGHSLIGSLLDAHPDVIIAHELDSLKYIRAGFNKKQLFYLLIENSKKFASMGREWTGYSYEVPNQWQGRFKRLRVLGDKKGGGTTARFRANPSLLSLLRETIGIPIKFVHVVRNPYDNISTISLRENRDLSESIQYYFSLCQIIVEIKKQIKNDDIFDIRHESFINNPKSCLNELCHFVGIQPSDGYLNDCASIVFKSPHESRHEISWDTTSIDIVKQNMESFEFLQGYSYDD